MSAYYNENDPKAAAWLMELVAEGLIAPGYVDNRPIQEVTPEDLEGYEQCHFFAGIGGWSYALRLAGWPDDEPVWTGSCPCQPFSAAGRGGGFKDERHLWPYWWPLILVCAPPVIFGEQVASPAGLQWLDLVSTDLEDAGYACGAADLCAAGLGAPHIRQRAYWVAVAEHAIGRALDFHREDGCHGPDSRRKETHGELGTRSEIRGVADADGWDARDRGVQRSGEHRLRAEGRCAAWGQGDAERAEADLMGDTSGTGLEKRNSKRGIRQEAVGPYAGQAAECASDAGTWACDWLPCTDGKHRPVEPGTFPLAHGAPARVGRLRGYGNAIVPQVAAAFIEAYVEAAS